jgi:hypothetical protein
METTTDVKKIDRISHAGENHIRLEGRFAIPAGVQDALKTIIRTPEGKIDTTAKIIHEYVYLKGETLPKILLTFQKGEPDTDSEAS